MTQNVAKQILPIIQAFADGKTIQWNCENHWVDCPELELYPLSSLAAFPSKYRIKPEPREWYITPTTHGYTVSQHRSFNESIRVREVL